MGLKPGDPRELGATPYADGVNFAVYADKDAEKIELCLFDEADDMAEHRFELREKEPVLGDDGAVVGYIWHGFLEGATEGMLYGYRAHGPYDPMRNQRFNPAKLLLDPYAKAVTGELHAWEDAHFPYVRPTDRDPRIEDIFIRDDRDNAALMPKARVVDASRLMEYAFSSPVHKLADTIVTEAHTRGATAEMSAVPEDIRGTYLGLATDAFISKIRQKHYTAVELLPIQGFVSDPALVKKGLVNYWGYMPVNYFAPHTGYATPGGKAEEELAIAVRILKENNIEVIMDVVYNHTGEADAFGPSLNFRGLSDSMYTLDPHRPGHYLDYTGGGNTIDFAHPMARRMVVDSLVYWKKAYGIGGFRFDLGTVLGREHGHGYDAYSRLMEDIRNHPELQDVKLIWEPWDLATYQLGNFPGNPETGARYPQWNGQYRDFMKRFALHDHSYDGQLKYLAAFLAGSSHIFASPLESLNFISSHDGQTLMDMVTYAEKHNEANMEHNRDGHDGYVNYGHEGLHPDLTEQRLRMLRFAVGLLAVSQGIPMLPLGHEWGKSQGGNSNAYAHKPGDPRPIAHLGWDGLSQNQKDMAAFAASAFAMRGKHAAFRRTRHLTGAVDEASDLSFEDGPLRDVTWLNTEGREIWGEAMDRHDTALGMLLSGDPGNTPPAEGGRELSYIHRVERERDRPMLVLINGGFHDRTFRLPCVPGIEWRPTLDSAVSRIKDSALLSGGRKGHQGDETITVGYRSLVIFEGVRVKERAVA